MNIVFTIRTMLCGQHLSTDLRNKIIVAYNSGGSRKVISEQFLISKQVVSKTIKTFHGSMENQKLNRKISRVLGRRIKRIIRNNPRTGCQEDARQERLSFIKESRSKTSFRS